jgi:hypothetical protein
MSEGYKSKLGVSKSYVYHQVVKEKGVVEYGWIPSDLIDYTKPLVVARQMGNSEFDNVTLLSDYKRYFTSLASMTPEQFLKRWLPSPRELSLYWYSNQPKAEEGTHEFMIKLASLIQEGKGFSHHFKKGEFSYEVVNVASEQAEAVRDKN